MTSCLPALSTWSAEPGREVLVCPQGRYTAAQLKRHMLHTAAGLQGMGFGPGDRLALALPNSLELVLALQACFHLGVVPMPLHPRSPAIEQGRMAALVGAKALLQAGQVPMASELGPLTPVETDPDAPALILQTSGSTGQGKAVVSSRRSIAANLAHICSYLSSGPHDVLHCGLPLSFGYGLYQLLQAMHSGARLVLETELAYPARTLATLAAERVSVFPAVPTVLAMVLQLREFKAGQWPGLHTITSAGADLPAAHALALRERFAPARVLAMYGLSECQRVSWCDTAAAPPGSMGRGLPGLSLALLGEDGQVLQGEAEGELRVAGQAVMLGYWPAPAATSEERLLKTGDLVYRDAQGWLYLRGRQDEVFKSRGEKVSPLQVEAVLLAYPGVSQAAVVGEPDPLLGQAVVAHVAPADGHALNERELLAHCRRALPMHARPSQVHVHAQLPKTGTGKVRRAALRGYTP